MSKCKEAKDVRTGGFCPSYVHLLSMGIWTKVSRRKSKITRTLQHTHTPYVLMSTHPPHKSFLSCVCATPLDKRTKVPKPVFLMPQMRPEKKEPTVRRCDCCRFFHAHPPTRSADQVMFTADEILGGGQCRRHPPGRDDEFRLARYPIVSCDWWCGEFKRPDMIHPTDGPAARALR